MKKITNYPLIIQSLAMVITYPLALLKIAITIPVVIIGICNTIPDYFYNEAESKNESQKEH